MRNLASPLNLRRSKSMPVHLVDSEYTGKPLFWFRSREVRYQNLTKQQESTREDLDDDHDGDEQHEQQKSRRPPRPFIRILGKIRCAPATSTTMNSTKNIPFLKDEERNDSFGTVATASDNEYEDNDPTLIDYSDDEEDYSYCFDDASEDDTLRGLVFLEDDRE